MGLVHPDLYSHHLEASGTAVTFPTPPQAITNELPVRNAFFESRELFFFSLEQMPAACRVCKHDMKGRRVA